ncbi:two component transcriptional regulator, LytTR family [Nonlabens sp. Hel1_33_55]|uniref:LytR/AlgR family response regulator transcription factor n=1 Tax=Nonlabens sp. Hel1_33_55 TaxID=1336802 RepID=UPI000875DECA|nr:response regulator transcription factor [Nonlabens sp. Hel1_33_55]SCX98746.1 two component transcriptional regulator, LytTR family [Nonlabens sp. Hel1_33_55]
MKLRVYVVEDMGVARASIINALTRGGHNVTGSATSAESAWMEIQQIIPDLVLIDINLKGSKDGIWLGQKVKNQYKTMVIFLTASSNNDHLAKIASMDADGYLMKPFNNPSLLTMIDMAARRRSSSQTDISKKEETTTFLKSKTGLHKVIISDIVYLQSEANNVHVFLTNNKYMTRAKLSDLAADLELPISFIRIHRRYLVNKSKIKTIHSNSIIMSTDVELPISKKFSEDIKSLI